MIHIRRDDLRGPEIAALLQEHLEDMRSITPPESKHALDLDALRRPDIAFFTLWAEGELAACGALRDLGGGHGELKSMRSAARLRGRGHGRRMLEHLLAHARERGFKRVSLETGAMPYFAPARALYASFGFAPCAPFGDYRADRNSVFLTLAL